MPSLQIPRGQRVWLSPSAGYRRPDHYANAVGTDPVEVAHCLADEVLLRHFYDGGRSPAAEFYVGNEHILLHVETPALHPGDFGPELLDCDTAWIHHEAYAPNSIGWWSRDDEAFATAVRAVRCREWVTKATAYHDQIQRQLARDQRSSLRAHLVCRASRPSQIRAANRDLGVAVGEYIRGDSDHYTDAEDVVRCLNGLHELSEQLALRAWRSIVACTNIDGEVVRCDLCGKYELRDNATPYESRDDSGVACSDCVEDSDNIVWSEAQDCYLLASDARPYYTSVRSFRNGTADDWVLPGYARSHMDCRECEDEPGFCDADVYYDVYGSDEDEEEEEEDDDGLASYHGSCRASFFKERNANPTHPPLGVELEVYAEDRADAVADLRNTLDWIYERDGSLDDDHGFEIVSPPMGYDEWLHPETGDAHTLLSACRDAGVVGYNATNGMYGIHINVHRRFLSPLQEARIMMFMCAQENLDLVRAVAQRRAVYGSPQIDMGSLEQDRQKIHLIGGLNHGTRQRGRREKKIYGVGKYSPINWKENIAEIRVFQSTTNPASFKKNLEFVWALIDWTKPIAATGASWHHADFVAWLAANHAARKMYPNLTQYLTREKYVVKGGSARYPIRNTWAGPLIAALHMERAAAGIDEYASEAGDVAPLPSEPEALAA